MYIGIGIGVSARTAVAFAVGMLFAGGEPGAHFETYNPDLLLQRRNQITYSQDFSQSVWTKDQVVPTYNNAIAPDGTMTASTFADNANPSTHGILYTFAGGSTWGNRSIHVKMGTRRWVYFEDGSGGNRCYFDLQNGALGTIAGGCSCTITAAANGFWRITYMAPTAVQYLVLRMTQADGGQGYAGTGDTIIVWGAQVGRNAGVDAYQKVTDWNTEYLAAAGSNVHMWQDNLRTIPVTAVEQTVGCWDDLSGNGKNATQATAGSRPKLSARYNGLLKTEQFSDAVWSKQNTTVASATDPNGGNGACAITVTAAQPALLQSATTVGASRIRCYLMAGTVSRAEFTLHNGAYQGTAARIISGPGVVSLAGGIGRVTGLSNSQWTLLEVDVTTGTGNVYLYVDTAGSGITNGTLFYAFPEIRSVNDWALAQPTYQRVNTATDYDTAGFIHYLKFDAFDDSLQTGAIDCSGVNKMTVWAGITKLSDAAVGIVAELSPNGNTDGGFYFAAPGSVAANIAYCTRGTTAGTAGTAVSTAPTTLVSTSMMDNAAATTAAQLIARVNGSAVALTYGSGPTTAGNYANAALNIGRRNNSTLPFNGRMTSLTVRGSTTPASTAFLKSMEQYAARLAGQSFVST